MGTKVTLRIHAILFFAFQHPCRGLHPERRGVPGLPLRPRRRLRVGRGPPGGGAVLHHDGHLLGAVRHGGVPRPQVEEVAEGAADEDGGGGAHVPGEYMSK